MGGTRKRLFFVLSVAAAILLAINAAVLLQGADV